MERREFITTVSGAVVGGLGGIAGCTAPEAGEGSSDGRDLPTEIRLITEGDEFYFDPIGLFVPPGTTITWVLESGTHSTTAYAEGNGPAGVTRIPDGATAWDSGVLTDPEATFEYTFETQGTYDYFCIPHKVLGMVGRIVVDAAGGPAEGSMPPDGDVPDSQTIIDEGVVPYDEFSG